MSTKDRSPEQYGSMARRWETPPQFVPIPPGATQEERLRLRFDPIHPPVGTVARVEWDRLGLTEPDPRPEILVPPDAAEYLTEPKVPYLDPSTVPVDDTEVDLNEPGPFADEKGGAQ